MGKDLKTHVASLYESKHEQERGAFYLSVRCLQRLNRTLRCCYRCHFGHRYCLFYKNYRY